MPSCWGLPWRGGLRPGRPWTVSGSQTLRPRIVPSIVLGLHFPRVPSGTTVLSCVGSWLARCSCPFQPPPAALWDPEKAPVRALATRSPASLRPCWCHRGCRFWPENGRDVPSGQPAEARRVVGSWLCVGVTPPAQGRASVGLLCTITHWTAWPARLSFLGSSEKHRFWQDPPGSFERKDKVGPSRRGQSWSAGPSGIGPRCASVSALPSGAPGS